MNTNTLKYVILLFLGTKIFLLQKYFDAKQDLILARY
jgi:hypothetical protein